MHDLELNIPSPEQAKQAEEALRTLDAVASTPEALCVHVSGQLERPLGLPAGALSLLMQLLEHMARGEAVAVLPVAAELTAQQAADILGVSRPFLIKLIDEGQLACRKVGAHRRIEVNELLAFKARSKAQRRQFADQLAAEAQAMGLEYE